MSRDLKRAARDLRRAHPHLTHAQALHELARTRGYSSWQALRAAQPAAPTPQAAAPTEAAFMNAISGAVLRALLTSAPGGNPRAFGDALLSGAATWADLTPPSPDVDELRGMMMTIKPSYTLDALEQLIRRVQLPTTTAEPTESISSRVTLHPAGARDLTWQAEQFAWIQAGGALTHWHAPRPGRSTPGSVWFEPDLPGQPGQRWGHVVATTEALLRLSRTHHPGQDERVKAALRGAYDWTGFRDALRRADISPDVQAHFPERLHDHPQPAQALPDGTWLTVRAPRVILPVLEVMLTRAGFPVQS